jgi:hypothetical protein
MTGTNLHDHDLDSYGTRTLSAKTGPCLLADEDEPPT